MNLCGPSAARLSDGLRAVFFRAPVPSGWTLTMVLSRETASILMRHDLLLLQLCEHAIENAALGPPIHPRVNGVPISETLGQSAPFAAMLGDVKDGIENL